MKTLYKCFALLLALSWSQISLANNPPPPTPAPPSVRIILSNTESGSQVCLNNSFNARAEVLNTSTSGLTYEWLVARGTVNGSGTVVRTSTNTVNCAVTFPLPNTNQAEVRLIVFRGTERVGLDIRILTVLPQTTPSLPGNIAVSAEPPSPNGAVCQFSGVTFSVPAVPGAFSYVWTASGSSSTSSSRFFTTSFSSSGNKTISVRARGCAGDSPARTTNVFVIPSNQAPCNEGPFAVAAPFTTSPNPATTTFALAVPESYVTATAQLTSQETGKVMKTFTVTGTTTQVATDDLPSGVYLLTVPGKDGKVTKRIVVQ